MALYHQEIYTTVGVKPSIFLDPSITPFNVNVAFTLVTGPVSYSLEFSLSDMDVSDANAIWFTSLDFPVATAASKVAPISAPVSRVRANIVTLTAGSLTLQTMQGFTVN